MKSKPLQSSFLLLFAYLPSRRSLRGPYLSMTIPSGRVMAESRKEPIVKARFSISSCSLQISQPFILKGPSTGTRGLISTPSPRPTTVPSTSKYSTTSSGVCGVGGMDRLKLELLVSEEHNVGQLRSVEKKTCGITFSSSFSL